MISSILWVVAAGFLEPVWVVALKRYNASKNILWGGLVLAFLIMDPILLSLSTDGGVPVSIAFSVWVSIGTVATTAVGYLMFKDAVGRRKVICIMMILIGVAGLQLFTGAS